MSVLPAYVPVHHMYAWFLKSEKALVLPEQDGTHQEQVFSALRHHLSSPQLLTFVSHFSTVVMLSTKSGMPRVLKDKRQSIPQRHKTVGAAC